MDVNKELLSLDYRAVEVRLEDLFPKLDRTSATEAFAKFRNRDPHAMVLNVARDLWRGGYQDVLARHGFYDSKHPVFDGHCHQCTPALGLALKLLGFDVSYLECYRIREQFPETGVIERVPPEEEPNPAMKDEFCGIGRIPYCCLEIMIEGEPFYVSGKHLVPKGDRTCALLTEQCYRDFVGLLPHQDEHGDIGYFKSGIYLQPVTLENGSPERVVWMKQKVPRQGENAEPLEYFAEFLRMRLS